MYSCRSQCGIIVRTESIKVFSVDFGCPVSSQQMVLEEDADFRNDSCSVRMFGCSYLNGGDQVLLTVSPEHTDGELASCQDDRLA